MRDYTYQDASKSDEVVQMDDIEPGLIFTAKDVNGEFIEHEDGGHIFEATSTIKVDPIMGPYVECIVVGD